MGFNSGFKWLLISCAIHDTNITSMLASRNRVIIFTKEVPYANYVHWNFSVLLIWLFIAVPAVDEWRFEDFEEEVRSILTQKLTKSQ